MATRLFVGNLSEHTEEYDLRHAFSSFGEVTNLDLKSKSATDESKKFAFVTLAGSNYNIESCIKHFSNEDFNGNRLYVTRARESFLERLQRERLETKQKGADKAEAHPTPKKTSVIKLGEKLNPRKRRIDSDTSHKNNSNNEKLIHNNVEADVKDTGNNLKMCNKKQNSEMKRMEAMKKKRQDFKEKQKIVKSGLTGVDQVKNKKIIFSDNEDGPNSKSDNVTKTHKSVKKNALFDEDDNEISDAEVNFNIKKHYEGKKGQKILDLQTRYKSDKRFVLDERFIEDDDGGLEQRPEEDDQIEVTRTDEKSKQLDILQDVLGVAIKRKLPDDERDSKKIKPKLGMLRFDPTQPDHAKFLAPIEDVKQDNTKKARKKREQQEEIVQEQKEEPPRPEVSKEQFYKVSDTLKEAIAQPTSFSLRSLFGNTADAVEEPQKAEPNYIPLPVAPKKSKVKNPLEPGEKNPFIYDSSDSETEDVEQDTKTPTSVVTEVKAVWKESFFFEPSDKRLQEGLDFFKNMNDSEVQKERRELKSLMKKRIYNKERKDQIQMFKKKIGGRKKTMKKSFRRKT